jgi:glycosyltransferase involved in cell wall biosynthesis
MIKFLSIIIPAYNSERTISACIESIQNLDFDMERFEVIVVDNNSTDSTHSIIEKYAVTVINEKKQGAAAARNCGVRHAKGDILCFIDADCMAEKDWLARIDQHFNDYKTSALVGFCIHEGKTLADELYVHEYNLDWEQRFFLDNKVFALTGANCAVRKDVFMSAGGFDESFLALEDIDLGLSLALNGYIIKRDKTIQVVHKYNDTLETRLKKTVDYGYFEYKVYTKNGLAKAGKYMPSYERIYFQYLSCTNSPLLFKVLTCCCNIAIVFLKTLLKCFMFVNIRNYMLYRFLINTTLFKGKLKALLKKCGGQK